jgi:hypothetical protein
MNTIGVTVTLENRRGQDRRILIVVPAFERRTGTERRRPKSFSRRLWHTIVGKYEMYKKQPMCPICERYCDSNIINSCDNCEYIKKEKRTQMMLNILLALTFATFVMTTYLKFHIVG